MLCLVEFGLIAPHLVNSHARDVPIAETYRRVLPFLAADTLRVALLLLFPSIRLWRARMLVP